MRLRSVLALSCLLVSTPTALLAGGAPPPTSGAPTNMPNLQDPARIALGKSTFESTCAAFCHGMEPPLFIGRQGLDPADAYTTISKGGGSSTPMPPWGDVFSNQEIWELVAYIDFLGTQKAGQPIVLPKANP